MAGATRDTLLLQRLLTEARWRYALTDVDRRALTPLFWSNVNPYGRLRLRSSRPSGTSCATLSSAMLGIAFRHSATDAGMHSTGFVLAAASACLLLGNLVARRSAQPSPADGTAACVPLIRLLWTLATS